MYKIYQFNTFYYSDIIGEEMLVTCSEKKIGGENCTVEIDESMFGKCKVS